MSENSQGSSLRAESQMVKRNYLGMLSKAAELWKATYLAEIW